MRKKNQLELPLLAAHSASNTLADPSPNQPDLENTNSSYQSHFLSSLDPSSPPDRYLQKYPVLDQITYLDMMPYVKKLTNNPSEFTFKDLPLPDKSFNIEAKIIALDSQWGTEVKEKNPSFLRAMYRTFLRDFLTCGAFLFIDATARICSAFFMAKMVNIINPNDLEEKSSYEDLQFYAVTLSVLVIVSFLAKNCSCYLASSGGGKARLVVSGFIYKKLNSISLTSVNEIKIGKVINLIANELNEIEGNALALAVLAFCAYMVSLGTFIMWQYFGVSCLIGLCSIIFFLFGQIYVSGWTKNPRKDNKIFSDNRVKVTNEIIECIRLIKMYTWEKPFKEIVQNLRKKELGTFMKIAYIDGIGKNFSMLSIYVSILAICIGYIQLGGILSPEKVYASMVVLMFLGNFCLMYTYFGGNFLINLRLMFKRVQEILEIRDILSLDESHNDKKASQLTYAIAFKDFTAYWNQSSKTPCLSNINLSIRSGTLTTIIGKIGSGKTTLLLSLLGEVPITQGILEYNGKIAFVEQEPVIFAGSIKENILFGKLYNEELYLKVIKASCLDRDLEILTEGDSTVIGERGVNLSGGQKARISLARAFYSESDIYLLDDPFAAVDSKVAKNIFNELTEGELMKGKTKILVTHHLNFTMGADQVVRMQNGCADLQENGSEIGSAILSRQTSTVLSRQPSESLSRQASAMLKNPTKSIFHLYSLEIAEQSQEDEEKDSQEDSEDEEKAEEIKPSPKKDSTQKNSQEKSAEVSWKTYLSYFTIIGTYKDLFIFAFLLVSFETLSIYYTRFIGYWALQHQNFHKGLGMEPNQEFDNSYYILLCGFMLLVLPVLNYIKLTKMNRFLLSTNTELHNRMLQALIKAPSLFFDTHTSGAILNRFSNDLGIMDKTNVVGLLDLINGLTEAIFLVITVCLINPSVFIPAIIVVYILYKTTIFFKQALITTKKLELESKAPLLSALPSTLQGLIIIRVYNQGGRFIRKFMDMIYSSSRAYVFMMKTIRLLAVILDSGINVLSVVGIIAFALAMLHYQFEPGLLGLSLLCLLRLGEKSNYVLRQILYVNVNMQSAQRMLDYCELYPEAPSQIPAKDKLVETQFQGKWPVRGDIVFKGVHMKYQEDLNYALNGLSFKIQGGTKVACVGRTGAGKSSIIQALFRMTEYEDLPESCVKIDNVDIKGIGLNLLRSKISIIPQTPVVFTGTIRRNLDPFEKLSDYDIWEALREVNLKSYVLGLENGLDTDMSLSGSVFSVGQKQLICLARAILSKNKIIVLDEATANVDVRTDQFIQKTIKEKFKNCTVVTIAHRLVTIADYDKVIVMDNGKLVEYDSPYGLLVEQIGDQRISKVEGIFVDMVRNTGERTSKKIFEIAKKQYYQNMK